VHRDRIAARRSGVGDAAERDLLRHQRDDVDAELAIGGDGGARRRPGAAAEVGERAGRSRGRFSRASACRLSSCSIGSRRNGLSPKRQ
jgi:hypothetical protein